MEKFTADIVDGYAKLIAKRINLSAFVSFARIANCIKKVPLFLQFAITK